MNYLEKRLEVIVRGELPEDVLTRLGDVARAAVLTEIARLDLGSFSEHDLPSSGAVPSMLGGGPTGKLLVFGAKE